MPTSPPINAILDQLWPTGFRRWVKVCAVLDGARDERIFRAVESTNLDKCCLYAGRLAPIIQEVAPHLVVLERDDKFTHKIIEEGWGQSWGVFLRTEAPFPTLRRHLRTFLKVKDHTGRNLVFRWYDPRVMRVYLPTCLPDELRAVFGPVDAYYMEGKSSSQMLDFRFEGGSLKESPRNL
jgi:hypothetical protein